MVSIKDENFFKYSAASMQTQILKTKYWLDGFAILNFEDKYYWTPMPMPYYFHYDDSSIKTNASKPICDIGTLETISFFIEIEPQLNAEGFQPISCTFKKEVFVEITHVTVLHFKSLSYCKVPVGKLNMLTSTLTFSTMENSIINPILLFGEETQ